MLSVFQLIVGKLTNIGCRTKCPALCRRPSTPFAKCDHIPQVAVLSFYSADGISYVNMRVVITISRTFVLLDDESGLEEIIAWRRTGNKQLLEPVHRCTYMYALSALNV